MKHYTQRVSEHSTDIAASRFENCRHEQWREAGTIRGVQQVRCVSCGKRRLSKGILDDRLTMIRTLAPLFKQGLNITQAAKRSGYCRVSVSRYYRKFRGHSEQPRCICGRSVLHQGWCVPRLLARGSADFIKRNLAKRWAR